MTPPQSGYTPGVCNIGPAEIAKRRAGGWIGLIVSVALTAVLIGLHAPRLARLVLFFPLLLAAVGFLQAQMRFCVAYGFAGMAKVITADGTSDTVEQTEFRKEDRRRAMTITAASLAVAVVATGVILALP